MEFIEPPATSEESKKISAISKDSVHKICSGQVVIDLAVAVKELVENSLDSGANSIEIKLIDYGKNCITVIDNGSGVLEKDFQGLGLKHHTSKLSKFSDLLEVETFGFRGEALSSLCSLSEVNIVTKHSSSENAFDLKFDKNGVLVEKKNCARQQGTTVHVKNIFKNLPVRAKEFERNLKKEFTKMIQILYSYCLVSTGIKITCTNTIGSKAANIVVSTNGSNNILDNVTSVFGRKARESLIEVESHMPTTDILKDFSLPEVITELNFTWKFLVSSCEHTFGRSTPDRQFFYINNRPCDPPKMNKLINHLYHKYNNKQYPFIYLNIQIEQNCADINVTPDKRTIMCTQENLILATIKSNLLRVWDNNQGTFTVKTLEEMNFKTQKRNANHSPENTPPKKKTLFSKSDKPENKQDRTESHFDLIKNNLSKKNKFNFCNYSNEETSKNNLVNQTQKKMNTFFAKENPSENKKCLQIIQEKIVEHEKKESEIPSKENENHLINDNENLIYPDQLKSEKISKHDQQISEHDNEISEKIMTKIPSIEMLINLESVKNKCKKLKELNEKKHFLNKGIKFRAKLDSKSADAEKEFERELSKDSFQKMQIIGQFNLGFIITRLNDDIFIVDQHATDEKFRFEKLSNETKLKTQKLIVPKALNLACLNETILIENQQIFSDNGFTFQIKDEASPGEKVKLTGMPVSYGWQFDQEDIEELIFLIREGNIDGNMAKEIPRPSRVRQMLASRACRSAVMIGKALNMTDMKKLLNQMSEMKNPWNCPHGRPTLRHLLSLILL